MRIIAALFIEDIQLRQVPGPATRIDLTGVQFSAAAPEPVPLTLAPHLVVLVYCPPDEEGFGALEVVYMRDGEQRSEEHTSELQSHHDLVCRLLLEKKKQTT